MLVAVLLLGLLLCSVDWRESSVRLRDVAPGLALTAMVLVAASIAISAWKWQLLLRVRRLRLGLPTLVRLYWVGAFFNNLLPATFGGDAVRLALARHIGGVAPVAASMLALVRT